MEFHYDLSKCFSHSGAAPCWHIGCPPLVTAVKYTAHFRCAVVSFFFFAELVRGLQGRQLFTVCLCSLSAPEIRWAGCSRLLLHTTQQRSISASWTRRLRQGHDEVLGVGFGDENWYLHTLQISDGDVYSRIDRTACGLRTTRPSRRLPNRHGWWTLQWHERKMQRVTVWHRCTLMEVRLTSLQAHTDLKWQIAPCWERSIFGATPTPTLRVTNAAEYIYTLWNAWNYTKLWTQALSLK